MAEPITVKITNLNSPIRTIKVSNKMGESAVTSVAGRVGDVLLTNSDIAGLENVNNTSDLNKPISTATQAAIDAIDVSSYAPINHQHLLADITNAGTAAAANVGDFATSSHQHLLSDITNAGTAAGSNIGDFATSTQGTKADSATQPGDNVSSLVNDAGYITSAGSNAVDSVNGLSGVVVLDPDNLDDSLTTNKFTTQTEIDKLSGIAANAEVNVNADWTSVAGDSEILNKPVFGDITGSNIADFATSGQGVLADSALQSGDNVSLLVNDTGYLLSGDNISVLNNNSLYVASGDNISLLTNDAGYLTSVPTETLQTVTDAGNTTTNTIEMNVSGLGQEFIKINATNSSGRPLTFYDNGNFVGGIDYNFTSNYWSFDVTNSADTRIYDAFTIQSKNDDNFIGMGTATPDAKLHVVGDIKIVNGTQGANKILTSDANGLASWQTPEAAGSNIAYTGVVVDYTGLADDYVVDANSADITISLPTAVGIVGKSYIVKNSSAGVITISPSGAETIDGETSIDTNSKTALTLLSTNSNWIII